MRAKDCPGCGAVLPISTKECSHCDYQFTSKSMLVSQQSAIEESNTIREKFPFEPERVRTFIPKNVFILILILLKLLRL